MISLLRINSFFSIYFELARPYLENFYKIFRWYKISTHDSKGKADFEWTFYVFTVVVKFFSWFSSTQLFIVIRGFSVFKDTESVLNVFQYKFCVQNRLSLVLTRNRLE